MLGFVLVIVVSAYPGQAIQFEYPDEPGLEEVRVLWQKRTVPFVRRGEQWMTVLGIDLDVSVGAHRAAVSFVFADGRTATRIETVEVRPKEFPTTRLQVEPRYVDLDREDLARAQRENRELAAIYSRVTAEVLWSKPFRAPIANREGRNFGHRRIFNGQSRNSHSGTDIRASTGMPIHATNRGRIVMAKDLFFSGNTVVVDHGLGVYSIYAHLSKILVEEEEIVKRRQVVGLAGATGRVTGPHLHWAVRVQRARVDPFSLISLAEDEAP